MDCIYCRGTKKVRGIGYMSEDCRCTKATPIPAIIPAPAPVPEIIAMDEQKPRGRPKKVNYEQQEIREPGRAST